MVFQSYELFPHLTVMDNILLAPCKVLKKPREQVREEARALLGRVGLLEKEDQYPRRLSGGPEAAGGHRPGAVYAPGDIAL